MYIPPISPDENKECYKCVHCTYDTWHDETWCRKWHHIVSGNGTCEKFESWEEIEKQKIKQQKLFE
jgi:hypothetical protein